MNYDNHEERYKLCIICKEIAEYKDNRIYNNVNSFEKFYFMIKFSAKRKQTI